MRKKDKRITFALSDKMLKDFNQATKENEETKSDVFRRCITKYIRNNEDRKNYRRYERD